MHHYRLFRAATVTVGLLFVATAPAPAQLVINPTFTANFNTNFGADATAAQNAWIAAANVFASNFNDNIQINITVDAVAGTSVLGQSNTPLMSTSYTSLRASVVADAKSASDFVAVGTGGSMVASDPASGNHNWWVSRAQAKALGIIPSDISNDGTTTFGAGFSYTFSGTVAAGTIDFRGVAAHEISEVMGRIGLGGSTINGKPGYMLYDNFSYTGAHAKGLGNGAGNSFSIDNGSTLLKAFNNGSNGGDSRDWASGTDDAFNAFSTSGVLNPVTAVDIQVMDILGYDLVPVPEPASVLGVTAAGLAAAAGLRRWWRSAHGGPLSS